MNWSVYSEFVGDVFGAPLAIEGLAAFFLESTFLGLWIFGWDRLSPRLHLATIWLVALGTWLSAYFILVANSWMQHPVGYKIDERPRRADERLGAADEQVRALGVRPHDPRRPDRRRRSSSSAIACWHLVRGREPGAVPARGQARADRRSCRSRPFNLWFGSNFGIVTTELPADEDRGDRGAVGHGAAGLVLALPDRRLHARTTRRRRSRSRSRAALVPRDRLVQRRGRGHERAAAAGGAASTGPATTSRPCAPTYWAMRIMAYLGSLVFLVAALGAFLYWRRRSSGRAGSSGPRSPRSPFPFLAALAGWVLTEVGRQPWIVQGLLKTARRQLAERQRVRRSASASASSSRSTSLLGVVDFVLMRRYARLDPPELGGDGDELAGCRR